MFNIYIGYLLNFLGIKPSTKVKKIIVSQIFNKNTGSYFSDDPEAKSRVFYNKRTGWYQVLFTSLSSKEKVCFVGDAEWLGLSYDDMRRAITIDKWK